jgi:hypothetical membrane protein
MLRRFLLASGVAAPLLYMFTVVLGGLVTPGYSHLGQDVSELVAAGAPAKRLLDPLFLLYNLLWTTFGLGLIGLARGARLWPLRAGGGLLVVNGALGVVWTAWFPMDPRGAAPTVTGTWHLVLAGITSAMTVLIMLLCGIGFGHLPRLMPLRSFSFTMAMVVLLSAPLAAVSAAQGWPTLGLMERLTIGGVEVWLLVTAVWTMRHGLEPEHPPRLPRAAQIVGRLLVIRHTCEKYGARWRPSTSTSGSC